VVPFFITVFSKSGPLLLCRTQSSNIRLEEDLARQVKENLNKQIDPVMAKMMAEVMKRAMEQVIQQFSTSGGGDSNK
jgi:tRNA A37 threonylcarbamoyltransferase TsaD